MPIFENPLLKVVIYSYKEVQYVSKCYASWCNLCKLLLTSMQLESGDGRKRTRTLRLTSWPTP